MITSINCETGEVTELPDAPLPTQEELSAQAKANALIELRVLEVANLMPRVTREFLIAATVQQAAALGIAPSQLLDPLDPKFSLGFKKMHDFNEQTKVLRAKL